MFYKGVHLLADALIDLTISGSALQIKYMTFIIYNHMNMTTTHAEHGYETQNMAIKTQKMAIKHGTAIYYDYQSPTLSNGVKLKSHLLSINFGLVIPPSRLEGSNPTYSFLKSAVHGKAHARAERLKNKLYGSKLNSN